MSLGAPLSHNAADRSGFRLAEVVVGLKNDGSGQAHTGRLAPGLGYKERLTYTASVHFPLSNFAFAPEPFRRYCFGARMDSVNLPRNENGLREPPYYRAQAEYCRQKAGQSEDQQVIRQKYLDLATTWDSLARQAETGWR